jgi:hypothetical protein
VSHQPAEIDEVLLDRLALASFRPLPFADEFVWRNCWHDACKHTGILLCAQVQFHFNGRQCFSSVGDKEHYDKMAKRQIESTDRRIDALVYVLYGLTDEEIRLIEAG